MTTPYLKYLKFTFVFCNGCIIVFCSHGVIMLQGGLFSNWGPLLSGTTLKSQQIRFHCSFCVQKIPWIALQENSVTPAGTGPNRYWIIGWLSDGTCTDENFNRELFVIAPVVGAHSNQTVFHFDISFYCFRFMNSSSWCFCLYQI